MFASAGGYLEVVQELIQSGCDASLRNCSGRNALEVNIPFTPYYFIFFLFECNKINI